MLFAAAMSMGFLFYAKNLLYLSQRSRIQRMPAKRLGHETQQRPLPGEWKSVLWPERRSGPPEEFFSGEVL